MAKSPEQKSSGKKSGDSGPRGAARRGGNAVTDYLDASEPLHRGGFEEAQQRELSGAPLTGSVSDWAEQIEREADSGLIAGTLEQLRPQFLFKEWVSRPYVDKQLIHFGAVLDQSDSIVAAPRLSVLAEVAGQGLLPPRHLSRRNNRGERGNAAKQIRIAQGYRQCTVPTH